MDKITSYETIRSIHWTNILNIYSYLRGEELWTLFFLGPNAKQVNVTEEFVVCLRKPAGTSSTVGRVVSAKGMRVQLQLRIPGLGILAS